MKDSNPVALLDEDAYVVGISYFPATLSGKLTTKIVSTMAEATGLKLPKRQNLKAMLTTFGKELYASGRVKLMKTDGICRKDVTIL